MKNMAKIKYFVDTSELINALLERTPFAKRFLFDQEKPKITNDYVIDELRRVLKVKFNISPNDIYYFEEIIHANLEVNPTPPMNRFKKLKLRDKSDRPIVQGAIDHGCILVIDDYHTYHDAKKYIETKTSEEIYQ